MGIKISEIHFLLGNKCNLDCDFCFWDKRLPSGDISLQQKIIDEIIMCGIQDITVSGGEPLTNPHCLDILAYAKNVGLNIVFHTNGLLITDEIANKLASLVSRVSLTMDGSTSEILMKMRKNIFIGKQTLHLVDIFHACDIPVSIKTLVSRINRDDIVNIGEILENLPISYWTLLEFVPLNRGELYKEKFFIKNNEFIEITDKIQGLYKNTQIRPIQYSKKTEGYCFITIDGKVYTYQKNDGDKIIGNIGIRSLSEILRENNFEF